MTTQTPTPLPQPRPGEGGVAAGVLRYELSRRDRLYLARRRLVDLGYDVTVRGPVPGGRTLLVLQVTGLAAREDLDRVARVVRGSDPGCRRV